MQYKVFVSVSSTQCELFGEMFREQFSLHWSSKKPQTTFDASAAAFAHEMFIFFVRESIFGIANTKKWLEQIHIQILRLICKPE